MTDDHDECELVNVSSGTQVVLDKIQKAIKRLSVYLGGMFSVVGDADAAIQPRI